MSLPLIFNVQINNNNKNFSKLWDYQKSFKFQEFTKMSSINNYKQIKMKAFRVL